MSETENAVDPYLFYAQLRKEAPVARGPDNGPYQVARHADVHRVLKDNVTFSSEVSIRPPEEQGRKSMLFSDPPIHHRLTIYLSAIWPKANHRKKPRSLLKVSGPSLTER